MLEGFEQYNLTIGLATLSVSENGIAFNKTATVKLGKPSYVKLFIDRARQRIAIQSATETDNGAIPFFKAQKSESVRWNNKELLKTITSLMNWSISGVVYKTDGEYYPDDKAMIFDLSKAIAQASK